MGLIQPKPYKQFDRATGQWNIVVPPPQDYNRPEKRSGLVKEVLKPKGRITGRTYTYVGKSDRYKKVSKYKGSEGLVYKANYCDGHTNVTAYKTEEEAALAVDQHLIKLGKAPINILKPAAACQK
ncbi:MAG: hypothetical protein K0S44_192 [Bacteroidetes bacterium]|jgi:hypothetical protein|nr:hypothetical protein [Bacteroidota bacterium]